MSFYSSCTVWTPSGRLKCPMKWGLSVLPSFRLSGHFLGIIRSLVFSEFRHGARNLYEPLYVIQPNLSQKLFSLAKLGKLAKNRPKVWFLNLNKKNLIINFHWIFSIMKIYIICCVSAQISYLEKIFFLGCKILSANQIAGFLNQLFLQNKSMN